MNLSVLLVCCAAAPIVVDFPADSIAIVDLRECLQHVTTSSSDRAKMVNDVDETGIEARNRHQALTQAEAKSKLEGATALDVAEARILKLEFDEFRRREQARLRKAEQDMFHKWHKQVDTAVKMVASREGFTIILFAGHDEGDTDMTVPEPKEMLTKAHAAYVAPQQRADITAKVVAEMSTDAFLTAVTGIAESEQGHAPELGNRPNLHENSNRPIR